MKCLVLVLTSISVRSDVHLLSILISNYSFFSSFSNTVQSATEMPHIHFENGVFWEPYTYCPSNFCPSFLCHFIFLWRGVGEPSSCSDVKEHITAHSFFLIYGHIVNFNYKIIDWNFLSIILFFSKESKTNSIECTTVQTLGRKIGKSFLKGSNY